MGPLAPAPRILCRPPGPEGHQAKHGAVLRVLTWGLLDNFKHRPIASVACELFSHFYMVGRNQEKSVGTHEPATEANGASRVCRGAASLPLQVPGKAQRRTGGSQESSLGPEHSTMGNGSQAGIQPRLRPAPGLAGGRCLLPAGAQETGRCRAAPTRGQTRRPHGDRRDALQDSETRGSAHGVTVADAETLPVFSKPYNDFFCSSSSCCLLCRHTKHLKDKDVTTLPEGADTRRGHRAAGTLLGQQARSQRLTIFPLHASLNSPD